MLINFEIESYGKTLVTKKRILVANKMDIPEAKGYLKRFQKKYKEKIYPISVENGEGVEEVLERLREELCKENSQEKLSE